MSQAELKALKYALDQIEGIAGRLMTNFHGMALSSDYKMDSDRAAKELFRIGEIAARQSIIAGKYIEREATDEQDA